MDRVRECERDRCLCSFPRRAFDLEIPVERRDPLAYPLKPEVPVLDAGRTFRIESASVVLDGEEQLAAFNASRDLDCSGMSVPQGVGDEFPDDA